MPAILKRLPFSQQKTAVSVLGKSVLVRAEQIVVWVSLGSSELGLRPGAARIPVILDTGTNFNFGITEGQLRGWTGFALPALPQVGSARVQGRTLTLVPLDVWLYSNRPGVRDEFTDNPPFRLHVDPGIAVYRDDNPAAPRLPVLGLRGLRRAGLQLHIDCRRGLVNLRTPWRFWPFF